jgi:regulator of protease activity HflC (stomatin/prohibitin superfamily)
MNNLYVDIVETGRTHSVAGGGVQPITDETGAAEADYEIGVEVEGVRVPIHTVPASYVRARADALRESQQQRNAQEQADQAAAPEAPAEQPAA